MQRITIASVTNTRCKLLARLLPARTMKQDTRAALHATLESNWPSLAPTASSSSCNPARHGAKRPWSLNSDAETRSLMVFSTHRITREETLSIRALAGTRAPSGECRRPAPALSCCAAPSTISPTPVVRKSVPWWLPELAARRWVPLLSPAMSPTHVELRCRRGFGLWPGRPVTEALGGSGFLVRHA